MKQHSGIRRKLSSFFNNKEMILRNLNIKTRLIVSFSLVILITISVISTFSYLDSASMISNHVKSYSQQLLNQTAEVLNNKITTIEKYSTDISMSDFVKDTLSKGYGDDDKGSIQVDANNFLTKKFIISNDIMNSTMFFGNNFEGTGEYSIKEISFDKEKVITDSKSVISWTTFEVTENDKKIQYLGAFGDLNTIVGKLLIIPKPDFFSSAFENVDMGKDSATGMDFPMFLLDEQGIVIASKDIQTYPVGGSNTDTKAIANIISKESDDRLNEASSNFDLVFVKKNSLVTYSKLSVGRENWMLVSVVPYDYLNNSAVKLRNKNISIGVVCLIISVLLCYWISKSVSVPLGRLIQVMNKAKEGDLTCRIEDHQKDEISTVCSHYNDTITNISSLIAQVSITTKSVSDASDKIFVNTGSTLESSEQIAVSIEHIAKGASEQAADINESVENVEQLSMGITKVQEEVAGVVEIANNVKSLGQFASETISSLNEKSLQVRDVTDAVSSDINSLHNSMREVSSIMQIMNSISEETNLLSLNASIEAARAGDAGRGFAVVANEIRKLSERSKEFTATIHGIISSVDKKTNDTVKEVNKSNVMVLEQIEAAKATEELFEAIFSAMQDVIDSIARTEISVDSMVMAKEKVIGLMESISAVAEESAATTEQICASTEEQTASAEELLKHTKALKEMSSNLYEQISKFKTE